jgi:hypothetical protein
MTQIGIKVSRYLWDVQYLYASTIEQHGQITQEDIGEVPEEGHLNTSGRVGQESAPLPAGLRRINPSKYMHNAHQNCARKRPTSALWPAVWGFPNK